MREAAPTSRKSLEQFFRLRCLKPYASKRGAISQVPAARRTGRWLFLPNGKALLPNQPLQQDKERASMNRLAQPAKQFLFSFTTSLVTEGTAFYNPSNTALGAVVWFTHTPVLNRQTSRLHFPRASA